MALPKYPELKSNLEKMLIDYFTQQAREELGPFKDVRRFTQHEGRTLVHNTLDNQDQRKEIGFKEAGIEYGEISFREITEMGPDAILNLMSEKAKEFGAQQARLNFQVLDEVTKEAGNVFDAGGKPITVDLLLDTISKISIGFDKFGNPQMPTLIIPESMSERYRQIIEEAEKDETVKKRMDEIIAQKKKEHDAEQARRKLVD